ncbi:MAG: GntR family transcriptional regulator, partial [bacterium]
PRDLFVPFREQQNKMVAGQSYAVYVYIDEKSNRIAASSRVDGFLKDLYHGFEEAQEVELIIVDSTPLGYKAIIDNCWIGILYHSEIFHELETGTAIRGFIKKIREDNKIDLSLHGSGYRKVDNIASEILEQLKKFRDNIEISDKSSPELIYQLFGVSKKTFKRAIGLLYKQKLITIDDDGVHVI